ncbi:hypothetical protein GGS20DRAFT_588901 [Poronia punctata]|nr:hypothetical protein GGS20DRAFT_588901 [Poronia punctata]
MASGKNRDIRGFFRKADTSSPQSRHQPTSPLTSSPAPGLDLPSSPRTPSKPAPRVFNREDEIKGSDDSDDDSDDSLGSITRALGYRSSPAAHKRDVNVLSTPQAKRIASGIHRPPLTLQPKRHRFDLKALVDHSRELKRTEESVRKADALISLGDNSSEGSDQSDAEDNPTRLGAASLLFNRPEGEEGNGHKLHGALKRSKDDEVPSSRYCYFFAAEESHPRPGVHRFPGEKAIGPWQCLAEADTRRGTFIAGLPHTLMSKANALPDEIFQWILDEVCVEESAELRSQYINLAGMCEDSIHRLVDDMCLYRLPERIGGPKYAREHSRLKTSTEARRGYLERNWSPLIVYLDLLERIAPHLRISAAISAVQLLLRMSLDPVVAFVVYEYWTRAITRLVSTLARHKSRWDTACEAVCSYIYENVEGLGLKMTAILALPGSTTPLVDLRRRLAAEALFTEPGLGGKPVGQQLSLEKINNRLKEEDFTARPKEDFDFENLRVVTTLLDVVIDRADFIHPSCKPTSTEAHSTGQNDNKAEPILATDIGLKKGSSAEIKAEEEAERIFNTHIDTLAKQIKAINDMIRDKDTRKNVKLALLGLEKRLRQAVRTRPEARKDIFSSQLTKNQAADREIPRQRDFMKQWALKKKEKQREKEREEEKQMEKEREQEKPREKAKEIVVID